MGFISKLFGDNAEKATVDFLDNIADSAKVFDSDTREDTNSSTSNAAVNFFDNVVNGAKKFDDELSGRSNHSSTNNNPNATYDGNYSSTGNSNTASNVNYSSPDNAYYDSSSSAFFGSNSTQPSGVSWGPVMPSEENQYNYNGTYIEYFEEIFNHEFSDYRIEKEIDGYATIFSFYSGYTKSLVVELLNSKTGRVKVRNECKMSNIPYLRYYYDHDGWWNTKSYVINRTKNALKQ